MGINSQAGFHPTLTNPSSATMTHFSTARSSGTTTLDGHSPARTRTCSMMTNFSTTSQVHSTTSLPSFAPLFHGAHLRQIFQTPAILDSQHRGEWRYPWRYRDSSRQTSLGKVQLPRRESTQLIIIRLGTGGPHMPSHNSPSISDSRQPVHQLRRGTSWKLIEPIRTRTPTEN